MARMWLEMTAGTAIVAAVALAGNLTGASLPPGSAAAAEPTSGGASSTANAAPRRRAGWWEFRMGLDRDSPSEEELCVGERSETVFSAFDQLASPDWCSARDFHREGDGWAFKTLCEYGVGEYTSGPVTTIGTITGDLTSDYVIHQKVSSKKGGTREGDLQARWVGECPAGKEDGDRVIGDYEMNVLKPGLF